jgi:hypothetical protein
LAQGWKITAHNIESFLSYLQLRLNDIISSLSETSAKAKDERDDNQVFILNKNKYFSKFKYLF